MKLFALLGVGALVGGCSSDVPASVPPPADGGRLDAGARDVIEVDQAPAPTCDEVKACDTSSTPPTNSICVVSLDATLVDLGGTPVVGEDVYVCGTNLCSAPIPSDSQGKVHQFMCNWFIGAAFKYLGGPKFATFAMTIPNGQPQIALPQVTLVPLPSVGVDFPPAGGDLVSNGVTLTVAANSVRYALFEPNTPEWHQFRAVEVPLANAPPFLDQTLKLEVLWGLAPANAALSPPAALKVPNTKGWAANATVELFLNGADNSVSKPVAPYGGWLAMGTGHVSADGLTVSSDTGSGVPMIGMLGMRLK